jgi:surface carbohydrate biosynthesis protein
MAGINLYLPITSQPRELDAKLLLALFARERGINPVLGYKSAFQCGSVISSPGIYFAHNARRSPMREFLSMCGHEVVVLDEEALVRQTDELFLKKHNKDAFKNVCRVFSWGEDDFQLWTRSDFSLDNVFITGNPRVDFLRPELRNFHQDKISVIKAEFGNYVLLNTNFPTVNNLVPQGAGIRLARWARDGRGKQIRGEFLAHKRALFERFLKLVPKLAKAISPHTLVVRPHPDEDHAPWLNAISDHPNAHIVFEGSVVPWIAGAHALIHNNCTTSIESAILGTPVLSYRPIRSESYDNPLTNSLGIECLYDEALISTAQRVLAGTPMPLSQDQVRRLQHHIANIKGQLSCEQIVDSLSTITVRNGGVFGLLWRQSLHIRSNLLWISKVIGWYTNPSNRQRRRALSQKFPQLKVYDLDAKLLGYDEHQFELLARQFPQLTAEDLDDRIRRISKSLDRFHGLRSVKFGDSLFTIV